MKGDNKTPRAEKNQKKIKKSETFFRFWQTIKVKGDNGGSGLRKS